MLCRLRLIAAVICFVTCALFVVLWMRSFTHEDHVYMQLGLGEHADASAGNAGLIPGVEPLINPQLSVAPPDPRDVKRRRLFCSIDSAVGKLGISGEMVATNREKAVFEWHVTSSSLPWMDPWIVYKKIPLGFAYTPMSNGSFGIATPFWFLTSVSGIVGAMLWMRRPYRFTLRGALVATTFVAVVLGMGVALSR